MAATSDHAAEHGIDELSDFALDLMKRLGEKALTYSGKGESAIKFDASLVTEAELSLAEYFTDKIKAAYPEHRIFPDLSETDDYSHEQKRYLWIFDPLDGVANFQGGIPLWGISIALFENHWPLFGIFSMPAIGELFYARAGGAAHWRGRPIRISPQETVNEESLLFTYSRFHQGYRTTFPGKVRNLGCAAAHICYVAAGRAEAALCVNESYQELAAATVILNAAGGKMHNMDGGEFFLADYLHGEKGGDHLIAASPGLGGSIAGYLR